MFAPDPVKFAAVIASQLPPDPTRFIFHEPREWRPGVMPDGGDHVDPAYSPLADATSVHDIERHLAAIETCDTPSHFDTTHEKLAD